MKPRAILFDLYGTLIDIETNEARPQVWDTLTRFLRYQPSSSLTGMVPNPVDQGLLVDGETLKAAFFARQQASLESSPEQYPELDVPGMFDALLAELRYTRSSPVDGQLALQLTRLYRTLSIVRFGLFSDTLAGLQALRGAFKLGLVSDAQRAYLEPEIAMTGLRPLFDVVVVSSDYGYRKPDPRLFAVALERLEVRGSQTIYVGDNVERDICGAHNAGLRAVLLQRHMQRSAQPPCGTAAQRTTVQVSRPTRMIPNPEDRGAAGRRPADLHCKPDFRAATLKDLCRRLLG